MFYDLSAYFLDQELIPYRSSSYWYSDVGATLLEKVRLLCFRSDQVVLCLCVYFCDLY